MGLMKNTFYLLIFLFLFSCSDKKKKPDWVLDKAVMVDYLVDMHMLEGKLTKLGVTKDSTQQLYDAFEQRLFAEHGLVDSIYYKSFNYYLESPELLSEIYTAVVDSLSHKEQIIKKEKEANVKVAKEKAEKEKQAALKKADSLKAILKH